MKKKEESFEVKIGDFGSAYKLTDHPANPTTVIFGSPEFYENLYRIKGVQNKSAMLTPPYDIWSLGLALHSLVGMKENFPWFIAGEDAQTGGNIGTLTSDWLQESPDPNSPQHLVWEMLRVNPEERISMTQLVDRLPTLNWSVI